MKKQTIFWAMMFVLAIVILTAFAPESQAVGTVKQAKVFMDKGQYKQAEAVLQARIAENDQDANSFYWLAVCQVKQGYQADQKFLKAIGLKPELSEGVATIYRQEAKSFLQNGQVNTARGFFDKAIEWNKDLKSGIAKSLFDSGQYELAVRYDSELKGKVADIFFDSAQYELAVRYDSGLADKIADIFFAKGEALTGEVALPHYREAGKYSSKHDETIKGKLLAVSKTMFEEKDVQYWRNAAAEFGEIPPEKIKIYKPGTYKFSLKAGEKIDHWITFTNGVITNYKIGSKDDKFQLLYDDGQIVPAWTPGNWPVNKYKFKIIAVTDQPKITMTVISDGKIALSQN